VEIMVHKPKHKVHSFRGLLGDGGEDEINLERQNVNIAYRIVKFELLSNTPGAANAEHVVKVYRESPSSITAVIDFSETDLLAAGIVTSTDSGYSQVYNGPTVIFDNTLFSRNIYVSHRETHSNVACNYYIELEEVPVGAATLMQLKLGVARKLNLQ